jgi:hypothetical protein
MKPAALFITILAALVLAAPAAAHKAHVHGVAQLAVAVDGQTLSITIDAPLDGFTGFERAPRTDAERKLAAEVLAKLKDAAALFKPDAAAGCTPTEASVDAPVLMPAAAPTQGEHADLEARYTFRCNSPQALRSIDVALFDAFRRLQRIEVQVAGARAQSKATLRRPARTVTLAR